MNEFCLILIFETVLGGRQPVFSPNLHKLLGLDLLPTGLVSKIPSSYFAIVIAQI